MLPRINRITVREFRKSPYPFKSFNTPSFHILAKQSQKNTPRFALFVPKSVDKRSTARNKTKRIISEIIKSLLTRRQLYNYDFQIKAKTIIENKEKAEKEINEKISLI